MMASQVVQYYSDHNVKSTLKKFNITYAELKEICLRENFVKSREQIRNTYRTTRIDKYGSIEGYRIAKRNSLEKNSFKNWINQVNSGK